MHIDRLKIADFRNLKDFEIAFTRSVETSDGNLREFKSHAVIGHNGTGKSNLMEAMIAIFRDLDLNNAASFGYEMDYTIRKHQVQIVAVAGKKPDATIDGKRVSAAELADHARKYLPSHVFVYYSGKNERIDHLFQAHQKRFIQALRRGKDDLIRLLFLLPGRPRPAGPAGLPAVQGPGFRRPAGKPGHTGTGIRTVRSQATLPSEAGLDRRRHQKRRQPILVRPRHRGR